MWVPDSFGCVHIQTAHLWWGMTAWDPRSRWEDLQDEREECMLGWEQNWKWKKTKLEKEIEPWKSKQGRRRGKESESKKRLRECWIGGFGKVNMLLFTVVSLKCCNFYKWTSFEILFQGNNNTWTAEMHFLLLEIYCTLESKPSWHHDFSPQFNLAKLYLNL